MTCLYWLGLMGLAAEVYTVWLAATVPRLSPVVQIFVLVSAFLYMAQAYSRPQRNLWLIAQRIPLVILSSLVFTQCVTSGRTNELLVSGIAAIAVSCLAIASFRKWSTALKKVDRLIGHLAVLAIWGIGFSLIHQIYLVIVNGPGGVWWYSVHATALIAYASQYYQGRETANPYLVWGYGVTGGFRLLVIATALVVQLA